MPFWAWLYPERVLHTKRSLSYLLELAHHCHLCPGHTEPSHSQAWHALQRARGTTMTLRQALDSRPKISDLSITLYRQQRGDLPSAPLPLQFVFGGLCSGRPGAPDLSPSHACDVTWASGASLSRILVLGLWTGGPEDSAGHPQLPGPQSQDPCCLSPSVGSHLDSHK